jgi:hypothetical protein
MIEYFVENSLSQVEKQIRDTIIHHFLNRLIPVIITESKVLCFDYLSHSYITFSYTISNSKLNIFDVQVTDINLNKLNEQISNLKTKLIESIVYENSSDNVHELEKQINNLITIRKKTLNEVYVFEHNKYERKFVNNAFRDNAVYGIIKRYVSETVNRFKNINAPIPIICNETNHKKISSVKKLIANKLRENKTFKDLINSVNDDLVARKILETYNECFYLDINEVKQLFGEKWKLFEKHYINILKEMSINDPAIISTFDRKNTNIGFSTGFLTLREKDKIVRALTDLISYAKNNRRFFSEDFINVLEKLSKDIEADHTNESNYIKALLYIYYSNPAKIDYSGLSDLASHKT